jgi:anti-sigma B factor antagonist
MALMVSSRSDRGVAIVRPQGKLTLGPALHGFQRCVDRGVSDAHCAGLVLDLAQVSEMDSAGIGELVRIHSTAAHRRFRVVLVRAGPRLKEMLAVTRVDGLFIFADDERSALAVLLGPDQVA